MDSLNCRGTNVRLWGREPRESKGEGMEDIFVELQITIEELRVQFESDTEIPEGIDWDGEDYMYYGEDSDLKMMLDEIRAMWYGWRYCARAYNIIKEDLL